MEALAGMLNSISNLALVIAGFTFIIFIHELGHFVAARWAGIRVLAFAIGFGPAIFSFRKGLGFRTGSSEAAYLALDAARRRDVSPTEYRLNWIPFGGYVKMLGQEDGNPQAVSDAPDSFQNCHPAKRLVVISAGVVMNVILAAILFVIVFSVGMSGNPARAGYVAPGSAASKVMPINADKLGITTPGILPGDQFLEIDGRVPNSFADLLPAVALASKDSAISLKVRRAGYDAQLHFLVPPEKSELTGLFELGVEPARSTSLIDANTDAERAQAQVAFARVGLGYIPPGSTLISIAQGATTTPVTSVEDLRTAARASDGKPLGLEFVNPANSDTITATVTPSPEIQSDLVRLTTGKPAPIDHIAGLVGLMRVGSVNDQGKKAGLQPGDIFLRIGGIEFPGLADGMSEIRSSRGRTIPVLVERQENGKRVEVSLSCPVDKDGRIGFGPDDTASTHTILAAPLTSIRAIRQNANDRPSPASSLAFIAGSELLSVNGTSVTNLLQAAELITRAAKSSTADSLTVTLVIRPPAPAVQTNNPQLTDERKISSLPLTITGEDLSAIRALSYQTSLDRFFVFDQILIKADSPAQAISKGLDETRRFLVGVYITFARLVERTVPADQLRGPIGIAAMGTTIADRGIIYLLFFMAMISVNLAVINFLPLPIVDGGQFLFILYEWIRGKAAPIAFQSAATLVGLILIGSMFLFVTFNDITSLFKP
jgi:regulator of sigma E protease